MATTARELELQDIQGLVLFGYRHQSHASFLLLRVGDPPRGRAWLRELAVQISDARARPQEARQREERVNLGLTADGLRALGLPEESLDSFSQEFVEGMSAPDRSRLLGDTERNAPAHWEFGAQPDAIHALLLLYANSEGELAALEVRQLALCRRHGVALSVEPQRARILPDGKEHFGFRDGISQPAIAGSPVAARPGSATVEAGEFILGYPNAYQTLPISPQLAASADPLGLLANANTPAGDPLVRDLGRNGTFLVFRKLAQDVAAFWAFMDQQTRAGAATRQDDQMIWLASKLFGRWPGGAPLVPGSSDDPVLGGDPRRNNLFNYAAADPLGTTCPIGAHVRRANPRDSLGPTPQDSLALVNRHRLIRRGRYFGPPLADRFSGADDGVKRGLFFIAINANISRQFEFIQQTWINSPKFSGLTDNKDPIVAGGYDPGETAIMTIPQSPVRRRIVGIPQFVTMRGGAYFFLPGITAIKTLANLPSDRAAKPASPGGSQTLSAPSQAEAAPLEPH